MSSRLQCCFFIMFKNFRLNTDNNSQLIVNSSIFAIRVSKILVDWLANVTIFETRCSMADVGGSQDMT